MRNGSVVLMHVNHLKVGDVVELKYGLIVPVDGVLISSAQLSTNEAAMTGESDAMRKDTLEICLERREEYEREIQGSKNAKRDSNSLPSPLIMSGTEVVGGTGQMLVVMVGENSALGMIMAKLKTSQGQTPLQKKLEKIASQVGMLGTYFALLTVHVLFVRYFIDGVLKRQVDLFGGEREPTGQKLFFVALLEWVEYFTIGVAVVVVAIPEGLPLAVMLSLAYSQRKMLADANYVKKLAACEIMGGADNICSDKTGTLTLNQMKVLNVWAGKDIDIPNTQNEVTKEMLPIKATDYFTPEMWKIIEQSIACNIPREEDYSATDKGMADFLKRAGTDIQVLNKTHNSDAIRFPFTSGRKRMSTIISNATGQGGYDRRLLIKGGSDVVKVCCTHYLDENCNRREITDEISRLLDDQIQKYAQNALRTIVMAYKDIEENENGARHDEPVNEDIKDVETSNLTLVGIVGIMDVIRVEVPPAVAKVTKAGVTVRMVTGDHLETAKAIAILCKILTPEQRDDPQCSVKGPDFYNEMGGLICTNCKKAVPGECTCSDKDRQERIRYIEKFKAIEPKLKVMARSRPEDKYLLVTGLRNLDAVVAVTGDGTNDAPALTKADVGFGMGITGTQVCKAAADIIIQDDSFTSVVKACSWGRNVFDNIQRFLQFQLTVNVNALLTVFICSALMKGTPLQAIQLLWVNLIMDSLAALALATEMPKPHLLERPPQQRGDFIVSRKMTKHILYMSIFQFIVIFVFVFFGEFFIPEPIVELRENPTDCCVRAGREYALDGSPLWYAERQINGNEYSRHITFIFHFFVFMQIWNMVCSRKIHDELNILEGILTNYTFTFIWAFIFILQFVIVEIGGRAFKLSTKGLSTEQHIIACSASLVVFIFNFILKFVPDRFAPSLGHDSVFEAAEKKRLEGRA